jgi:hypothetical protein
MSKNYYFILMSQKDFLENQVIEEILREKANYYNSKQKIKDFWIVNSPSFINDLFINNQLKKSNFYKQKINNITKNLNDSCYEFYSSIITSDIEFIKWIKLRLGYFEDISDNLDIKNNNYVSDGICGLIKVDNNNKMLSPLKYNSEYIHPDILLNKYKKSIEIYYKLSI